MYIKNRRTFFYKPSAEGWSNEITTGNSTTTTSYDEHQNIRVRERERENNYQRKRSRQRLSQYLLLFREKKL